MTHFRFVGTHQDNLSDGTGLEPGQFIDLERDSEDEGVQRLLAEGLLLEIAPDVEPPAEAEPVETPKATAAAEHLAMDSNIDLSSVEGTGSEGTITKADIEAAIKEREGS